MILRKLKRKKNDHDHSSNHITTQEFNNLMLENVATKLAQANLASENGIADFVKKKLF